MTADRLEIIDVHTHTELDGLPDPVSGIPATLDQYLADRERAGVVGGVTDSSVPGAAIPDLRAYNLVRCAVIADAAVDAAKIERGLESGVFGAIKINLGFVHCYAFDERFEPLYRLAERHGVPVLFHTGDPGWARAKLKYADPLTIDEVAVDHPDVRFVLVHAGNPWFETAAAVAYKNPNVYIEASALLTGDIGRIPPERVQAHMTGPISWLLGYLDDPAKLLFGSGWPMVDLPSYVEAFKRAVPREHWAAVFHDNAARLFKIG